MERRSSLLDRSTVVERRFRAMGTDVHVIVTGGDATALDRAEAAVRDREARWSRFLPTSELSQLNAAPGRPVRVSADTFRLVSAAIDAFHQTGGAFDPTVGGSLVAAGYDRSFELIDHGDEASDAVRPPSPLGIELHDTVQAIVVPPGTMLDLGGIAKGATAEAVTAEIVADGAKGCCLNIGGDLRAAGLGPDDGRWHVVLDCPGAPDRPTIALTDGAVCTSTTLKRRWTTSRGPEHHLRHPATGASLASGLVTATVIAARADQAEVLTKAALVAGPGRAEAIITGWGATGLLIDDGGNVIPLAGLDRFLASP